MESSLNWGSDLLNRSRWCFPSSPPAQEKLRVWWKPCEVRCLFGL